MADLILFTDKTELKSFMEELLPVSSHEIITVCDIDECMKILYSHDIEGIIIDSACGNDLASLARKIRVVGKKNQPFVLLYSPIDYENDLLFRYIDGFLPKNATKSQLKTLINSALRIEKSVNAVHGSFNLVGKILHANPLVLHPFLRKLLEPLPSRAS